jgi:hypothetical protein
MLWLAPLHDVVRGQPVWIATGATSWTRNIVGIVGIDGSLAATQTDSGTVALQLTSLHGDTVFQVDDTTTASLITSYAESRGVGRLYFPAYAESLMDVRAYNPDPAHFNRTDDLLPLTTS